MWEPWRLTILWDSTSGYRDSSALTITLTTISNYFTVSLVLNAMDGLGQVIGWGTMLQAERSQVRFPMRSLDCAIDLILPAARWHWSRLSLRQMCTRNLPGG
jgi:hypothetical protein